MTEYDDLESAAQVLDADTETVEELVDVVVDLGNKNSVFTGHDSHLGLKDNLSGDFLSSPLNGLDEAKFGDQIESLLDEANIIIALSTRELSDDDIEEIEEDKMYRGEDFDD